jgi:hypothetical protein
MRLLAGHPHHKQQMILPWSAKPSDISEREEITANKAWVSTTGNLVWYRQHTQGGHFAALERPKDLFKDIEDFVEQIWK